MCQKQTLRMDLLF
ncbi:hypothetical protein E2C01_027283 [Portunus trituberculatus]|uniref:Uncharacterized protein n=1 Tax=Portunus trituberculatus TaxID=210409 RepID=A0A5B7EKF2_PORTR|nr:hypothetical protein [Portunus trituberculatus]